MNYWGYLASVDAYLRGLQAAQDAEDARLAAIASAERQAATQRVSVPASPQPQTGVGDCSGFVIPDYIIQRESGGQPFVKNANSDAFGCAQTLLSHYYGGACSGLDPYTIQGQRDCVYRLSNGGTNLAPWATG